MGSVISVRGLRAGRLETVRRERDAVTRLTHCVLTHGVCVQRTRFTELDVTIPWECGSGCGALNIASCHEASGTGEHATAPGFCATLCMLCTVVWRTVMVCTLVVCTVVVCTVMVCTVVVCVVSVLRTECIRCSGGRWRRPGDEDR